MRIIFLYTYTLLLGLLLAGCSGSVVPIGKRAEQPTIFPAYSHVTFPPNIAPPNCIIQEAGEAFYVELGTGDEVVLRYHLSDSILQIDESDWHAFTDKIAGSDYFTRVYIKRSGEWIQLGDIINHIAIQPIDPYLVYRLLSPGYELWNKMGIYQRDLTSFEQTTIVENKSLGKGCVNCHTFCKNSPETMLLHIRGKKGGTVLVHEGKTSHINTQAKDVNNRGAYAAWHPSGRFVAFSANDIKQFFHLTGKKPIEVSDMESDLVIYDVEANQTFTDSVISGKRYMETFPNWSPDGKTLFFCRANALSPSTVLDSIRYDLFRASFDPETRQIGEPECIYHVSDKKSISFPRISPDGKYLMFTLSDYGNFSIWHPESELCLLNMETLEMRVMEEVNSKDVESFHTWDSSGRWFVFSSKRMDGLWARPYFAYFDPTTGRASKPFLLPQKDPDFYDHCTLTFNLPELITAPITDKSRFYTTADSK